jgi:hypothetical protein
LQFFWTAANTKAMKDQTFAMFLLNGALRGYRAILASVTIAQGIWTVLMGGTVRNANGTFRAMTFLERVARSLRYAFILLFTQMRILATFLYESLVPAFIRTAIAAAATWVAALGPIAWIIAGVIALIAILTVLYFKWKWFHDLVNRTVRFLWEHPFVAWFIPVIGPLLVIVRLITFIFNHLGAIARFFGKAWHFAGHVLGAVGLQSGGTMRQPGFALVGERGPELLLLPGGSTVLPLPATTVNKHLGGGAHETAAPLKKDFKAGYSGSQDWGPEKPLVIQLLLDKKVLEEVVVRRQSNRMSRR